MTGIGALRRRVALERPDDAPDGAGGRVLGFAAMGSAWAEIAPARAVEAVVAGRFDGVVTHRVTIRFRADVGGGWRLVLGERVLRVLAAFDPDERRRRLTLLCEEEGR